MSETYMENLEAPAQPLTRYQLIRVNAKRMNEGCKWVDMFEDVRAVIFYVVLSDYDKISNAKEGVGGSGALFQNKMMQSRRELFETVVRQPCFKGTPFVLFLNKYDIYEGKVSLFPLVMCEWFDDLCPVLPHNNSQTLAHQAYYYVAIKFKDLYASVTTRKLFVWQLKRRDGGRRVKGNKGGAKVGMSEKAENYYYYHYCYYYYYYYGVVGQDEIPSTDSIDMSSSPYVPQQ